MHRVDSSGNIAGAFQDGNPAVGQQATQLTAAWFNDVQENLCKLIEQAGLTLEKGNYDQLYDAMVLLLAGVVGTGGGEVPTTRRVDGGGLVTGGGPLTADLVLSVLKASTADVQAGTADDRAITPLALAQATAAGLLSNGYYRAAGGLIMQWGTQHVSQDNWSAVIFPIAFPNALFNVQVSWMDTSISSGSVMGSSGAAGAGLNGFSIYNDGQGRTHHWFAIGK